MAGFISRLLILATPQRSRGQKNNPEGREILNKSLRVQKHYHTGKSRSQIGRELSNLIVRRARRLTSYSIRTRVLGGEKGPLGWIERDLSTYSKKNIEV